MGWVLDLDGVVWLAQQAVPGAPEAVARLRAAGEQVLFVTNNSSVPVDEVEEALAAVGIPARGDVLTSAMAAARLVPPAATALVCGGVGITEALRRRGVRIVGEGPADVVVVGFTRAFDFDRLTVAFRAVRDGARLLGTNDDPTYPTPEGPLPGGGSILAAVATAAGVTPEVAGKPHPPMADLVRDRAGPQGVVVGDRPSTDGRFARALGYRFALVLSGVTSRADLPVDPAPDSVVADLGRLVDEELGRR